MCGVTVTSAVIMNIVLIVLYISLLYLENKMHTDCFICK